MCAWEGSLTMKLEQSCMPCTSTPVLYCSWLNSWRGTGRGGANTGCVVMTTYQKCQLWVTKCSIFIESLVLPGTNCAWSTQQQIRQLKQLVG